MENLKTFARALINNWFFVLSDMQEARDYFSFSDWINIWYVQKNNYWICYDFKKTNKPSKETWTWFQVLKESELSIENAKKTLNSNSWIDNTIFYKSMTDFIEYERKFWKNYWILTKSDIENFIN